MEMDKKDIQLLPRDGKKCESMTLQNSSLAGEVFRVMESLRKEEILYDIMMKTDDDKIVYGHKIILASASPYFKAMFTNFNEKDKDLIYLKSLDYTSVELIISYIYTGKIIVNKENVLDLLKAANLLSIDNIKDICTKFLGTQLDPSNCIGIYQLADSHDCKELKACSEAYIKTKFMEVVKYGDYLCLSAEELIEIISSNDLNAPLEQNVFETVINWVHHELDSRKQYFKNLLAPVRLPLIPNEYLLNNVVGHPLIEINPECKNYVNDALQFNFNKSSLIITIPQKICCTRRSGNLDKIILMPCWAGKKSYVYWYDPAPQKWKITSKFSRTREDGKILLLKDQFVVILQSCSRTFQILDLYSPKPCWIPMPNLRINRYHYGVGSINNSVYVVGGIDNYSSSIVNSVVVYDISVQEWRMVASMSKKRILPGVGVLNNMLYAVGGWDNQLSDLYLKSVECYDPSLNTWKPVAEMSIGRSGVGIGVLDGIIYAIGGSNKPGSHCKVVEAYKPSDGFWTRMADLNLEQMHPEVVTLHGLIYVMAGRRNGKHKDSVEIYNPKTNTWKLMETCIEGRRAQTGAIVIDRPPHF